MQRADRLAPLAGSVAAVVLVTAAIFLLRGGVPVLSLGSLYVLAGLGARLIRRATCGVLVVR